MRLLRLTLPAVFALLLLAGCATRPLPAALPDLQPALARGDQAYAMTQLPSVDPAVLFALPPDLAASIARERMRTVSHKARLIALLDLLYGPDRRAFTYGAPTSTDAAQTWAAKRGDCLSLTLLTYASARAMGLNAQMQEVRVPAIYERRSGVDFVNRHVNVAVHLRNDTMQDMMRTQVAMLDFEPQLTGGELGHALDERGMVARFHNNLGGQALAAGDAPRAYAHYRAAIAADPEYGAAQSNLAVLLEQRGLLAEAEALLRHAVVLSDRPDVALAALRRVLVAQHRDAEAQVVAQQLRSAEDADPYHWIALGLDELAAGRNRQAVDALEHAQQLTAGFGEVHGWLALAYARLGESAKARQQLAQLDAIEGGARMAGKVRKQLGVQ
ncbi:tetratricopeptide repeat protein [Ramlibacter algicola]|uniref:Tetratricopeptide repeat protein n=1 Tax=Ramlibacter algicola TaxID=2795217 RepID=A0A934PZ10_9BURK|nr:tetratricopeptide repeat protein [Ramlibacter algicola]MBK0391713.1 tetratricopeptide repeat protein [Ramlibacter algicola]